MKQLTPICGSPLLVCNEITMWLQPLIYLLIAVTHGFTKDVGFRKFHSVPRRNKIQFEDKILKEFPSTSVLISTRDSGILDDVTTIKDKNTITLRYLKLDNEPNLRIDRVNSTLEYLSMRLGIKADDDVVFSGEMYVDDDQKPVGDVSYTLKNLRGDGIVGLGAGKNSTFTSTNYLIDYEEDETILNGTFWNNKNTRRYEIDASHLPAKRMKIGIRRVMNGILKKRLDATLAKIQLNKVYAFKRSNVGSIKRRTNEFYNGIVDSLLAQLNSHIMARNMSRVALGELEVPFTYKLFGMSLTARVIAWEGWFENLATFVRRGPITVTFDTEKIMLFGVLGLETLRLGYDVCAIQIAGFGPYAKISGSIGENAAQLAISINFQSKTINLGSFELTKLENIAIHFEGLGPFNWVVSKVASKIANVVKKDIVPMIEPKIEEEIRHVLKNINAVEIIDNILPHPPKRWIH